MLSWDAGKWLACAAVGAAVVVGGIWGWRQAAAAAAKSPKEVPLPPPIQRKVEFRQDVVPILLSRCARCHTGQTPRGGFQMDTRERFLQGGDSGEPVRVGHSGESLLVELVAGRDAARVMPAQGPRLTAEQIGIVRAWIDQGLAWEAGFSLAATRQAQVEPRRVPLPPATAQSGEHPIDRLLAGYWARHGVKPAQPVSDEVFLRRVYLDLVGLVPTPEQLAAFGADRRPEPRVRLVESLLADRRAYADHWLTFWNDALRNAYRGTGYIDGGRRQITRWLYQSLYENRPLDRMVHELVSPTPESAGFIDGIRWRGVVNASQRTELQAAQNLSQVFLGTNLKCASCHDSFVNEWKLTDAYGLACVFADGPLELNRCDKPTGQTARPRFIYGQLGDIDPKASKPQRMQQLADILSSPRNGRLARTMVNRLWAWLLGRGIVEPVDDMDQAPFDSDLLDWLAADLIDHGWDLKHTLRQIATSRAYQRPAVAAPRPGQNQFVFAGPLVRRMTAEQFVDAVSALTGVWQPVTPDMTAAYRGGPGGQLAAVRSILSPQDRDGPVRASLANDDRLTRALGRPNREQVVTRRDSIATTLEALELSNGDALDRMIHQGASRWLARPGPGSDPWLGPLYLTALGRRPTPAEAEAARSLLGKTPTQESMRDLLWVLVMLPDYQLIH